MSYHKIKDVEDQVLVSLVSDSRIRPKFHKSWNVDYKVN